MITCTLEEAMGLLGMSRGDILELTLDGTLSAIREDCDVAFRRDEVETLAARLGRIER